MPWEKGQSGNPNGRPRKGEGLSDQLRNAITDADRERIFRKVIAAARKGDMAAVQFIFDRIDGRARQAIEHSGPEGGPIELNDARERLLSRLPPLTPGDIAGEGGDGDPAAGG